MVVVDGADVSKMTRQQLAALRSRTGFIWQEYNVIKRLSAFKNVLTGRLGHRRELARLCHFFTRWPRERNVRDQCRA
jgi:phosphonate transport system ATP-binding protein